MYEPRVFSICGGRNGIPQVGDFFCSAGIGATLVLLGRCRANGGHISLQYLAHFMREYYGDITYCFHLFCAFCTHISMFYFICSVTTLLCVIKEIQPTPVVVSKRGRYNSHSPQGWMYQARTACLNNPNVIGLRRPNRYQQSQLGK